MLTLIQNSALIAENIRRDYLEQTSDLVDTFAQIIASDKSLHVHSIGEAEELRRETEETLQLLKGKRVAAIDGGLGRGLMGSVVPFIIRTVTFSVRLGDRSEDREKFEPSYYKVNRLTGGALGSEQLLPAVLLIFELQAALKSLMNDGIDLLIIHGPLARSFSVFLAETYYLSSDDLKGLIGNSLFTEFDNWLSNLNMNQRIKSDKRFYTFFCMNFLLTRIVEEASNKNTMICGVVERTDATEIIQRVMFSAFNEFSSKHGAWLKKVTGNDPNVGGEERIKYIAKFINSLGYTDPLIFGSILKAGQYLSWQENRSNRKQYDNKQIGLLTGFIHAYEELSDIIPLTHQTYVRTSQYNLPFKVEIPLGLSDAQKDLLIRAVFAFSQFLPSYAFPVNLDVVDKLAKVPNWITNAMMAMVTKEIYEGIGIEEERINYMQLLGGKARDWELRPGVRRRLV